MNPSTFNIDNTGNAARLARRAYGKSGVQLSIVGFGGIIVMNAEQNHANHVVAEAVERGINYFDVAPSYGDAEEKLGPALEPYRKNCFLACKTGKRDAAAARQDLDRSLVRLRTDYLDLYQLHGIIDPVKDVEAAFAPGGVMEMAIEAKKAGQIRHLGFSAHSIEAALLAMDRFDFDSILMPVNFATYYKGNFGPQMMDKAMSKGVARMALKAMALGVWPENDPDRKKYGKCWYKPISDSHLAELALRFALDQPITAALPPGEEPLFRMALDMAMRYKPLTEGERAELKSVAMGSVPIFQAPAVA